MASITLSCNAFIAIGIATQILPKAPASIRTCCPALRAVATSDDKWKSRSACITSCAGVTVSGSAVPTVHLRCRDESGARGNQGHGRWTVGAPGLGRDLRDASRKGALRVADRRKDLMPGLFDRLRADLGIQPDIHPHTARRNR